MDESSVVKSIIDMFPDVETSDAFGYTFFFVGSERMFPFATLATRDDDYDCASNLNRPSVFRLNIGVNRNTYRSLFGSPPSPPGPSGVVDTGHDFTVLDRLLPHPVYAPQSWICVLSPSDETFLSIVKPLLSEAYARAAKRQRIV